MVRSPLSVILSVTLSPPTSLRSKPHATRTPACMHRLLAHCQVDSDWWSEVLFEGGASARPLRVCSWCATHLVLCRYRIEISIRAPWAQTLALSSRRHGFKPDPVARPCHIGTLVGHKLIPRHDLVPTPHCLGLVAISRTPAPMKIHHEPPIQVVDVHIRGSNVLGALCVSLDLAIICYVYGLWLMAYGCRAGSPFPQSPTPNPKNPNPNKQPQKQ